MSGSALLAQLVHTGPEPTVIVLLFVLQSFLLAPKQSSTHPYELVFFFFLIQTISCLKILLTVVNEAPSNCDPAS